MKMLQLLQKRLDQLVVACGGVLLVSMSILTLIQVFSRYVTRSPFTFSEEFLRFMLIWTGLLGTVYCFSQDRHLAVGFVAERFARRSPRHRQALKILVFLLVSLFVVLVMLLGGLYLTRQNMGRYSPMSGASMAFVYGIMPVSGLLSLLALACRFFLPTAEETHS